VPRRPSRFLVPLVVLAAVGAACSSLTTVSQPPPRTWNLVLATYVGRDLEGTIADTSGLVVDARALDAANLATRTSAEWERLGRERVIVRATDSTSAFVVYWRFGPCWPSQTMTLALAGKAGLSAVIERGKREGDACNETEYGAYIRVAASRPIALERVTATISP
jgi:hypothetical protein